MKKLQKYICLNNLEEIKKQQKPFLKNFLKLLSKIKVQNNFSRALQLASLFIQLFIYPIILLIYQKTMRDILFVAFLLIGTFCFTIQNENSKQFFLAASKELYGTNQGKIQQILDGVFDENMLPKSRTIIGCIDEDTAGKMVQQIGKALNQVSKGSASDILRVSQQLVLFYKGLPQNVKNCLENDEQVIVLSAKYGIIDGDTTVYEKKYVQYITLHYLSVHKMFGQLNKVWKSEKYYQSGFDGASYFHMMVG